MTQSTNPISSASSLTWDAVIATRNRPEALALSIPLLLQQTRPPEKLVVIDSSDDHGPVAEIVAACTKDWKRPVIVEHSAPGLPYQRNLGLQHVTADVVIFPDDDSLFYLEAAARIMEVYELDNTGEVSGVCGLSVPEAPPETVLDHSYKMTDAHKRDAKSRRLRNRIEKKLTHLKPALYLGQLFKARHGTPPWLDPKRHSIVEYMTGFRMSFRSDAIKARGFDETLTGYGLDEDVEASLAVGRDGLLIGAREAFVYHHKNPTGRAGSFTMGAIAILNRTYVICKHIVDGELNATAANAARTRLRWFIRMKLLTELRLLRRQSGRERWHGAWAASRQAPLLMNATRDDLPEAYAKAQTGLGL